LIQELITYGSDADREIIWEKTKGSIIYLSNEASGNYCVQKFLEHGNKEMIEHIVDMLNKDLIDTSLNS